MQQGAGRGGPAPRGRLCVYGAGIRPSIAAPVISPNALDRKVAIRITETGISPMGELADWSPVYHFEPETLRFNQPVEVRLPWTNSLNHVTPGLAIYWSDDAESCALAPLDDNYQNAGFNQGSVLNLGWAIVGAPRADACP